MKKTHLIFAIALAVLPFSGCYQSKNPNEKITVSGAEIAGADTKTNRFVYWFETNGRTYTFATSVPATNVKSLPWQQSDLPIEEVLGVGTVKSLPGCMIEKGTLPLSLQMTIDDQSQ